MHVNFIFYIRGAGGNFLTRALAFDSTTVALGDGDYYDILPEDRLIQYGYKDCPRLPASAKEWWDFELKNKFPIARLGIPMLEKLDLKIIEAIHPDNFKHMNQLFGMLDTFTYLYICTDDASDWLIRQRMQKNGASKLNADVILQMINAETEFLEQLPVPYLEPIYLKEIIKSKDNCVKELNRVADILDVKFYPDLVAKLYQEWTLTWG